jgi:hypothetical protein
MRKLLSFLLVSIVLIAPAARADTIHLKNGSILKGKVASFADDQFVVMLDTGSGRYMSRAMVYIGDVARIEFDSLPGAVSDATPRETSPPRETLSSPQSTEPAPRVVSSPDPPRSNPSSDPQPRQTNPPDPQPSPAREPEPVPTEKPTVSAAPTLGNADTERPPRKSNVAVKSTNIDVLGKRDWTSTGLIVKRGDRIRITATGNVTIDPASGRTSGPEGTTDIADPKKLMPDQPTGALIGVIGADNDDFIFIGRSAEFTATRDGLLFLSVNEGTLADNAGTFRASIEIQKK